MFFFNIGTNLYFLFVRIASLWNSKAKLFIDGRVDAKLRLKEFNRNSKGDLFWFHCASLGEFEQARPLIEKLKLKDDKCQIVVTFFSPSGFEIKKGYELADLILYLPKDSKFNAELLLNSLKPTKIFFVKYEFWANYLLLAKQRGIETYLVSGVFREKQIFFKWYGGFMRSILASFSNIFLQDKASKLVLDSIGIKSEITGDTRFDRVMENAKNVKQFPLIKKFIDGCECIVVGSCWEEDEQIIFPVLNNFENKKLIVAPHELGEAHFTSIEKMLNKKVLRYSNLSLDSDLDLYDVLLIDNIGILMHLYQYANIAYVGGAFGKGLHNILEPASFGVPVIFGNSYSKFPEAYQFLDAKIGFSINNEVEFENVLNKLSGNNISDEVLYFMEKHKGATDKILKHI